MLNLLTYVASLFEGGRLMMSIDSLLMIQASTSLGHNMKALIFRIGYWGALYYTSNKEPPK